MLNNIFFQSSFVFQFCRKPDIFCFQGSREFIDSHCSKESEMLKTVIQNTKEFKDKEKNLVKKCPKSSKEQKKKKPNRMGYDKIFLQNLSKQIENMDIDGPWGASVTSKAIEGIKFLQRRDDFWNQIDTL